MYRKKIIKRHQLLFAGIIFVRFKIEVHTFVRSLIIIYLFNLLLFTFHKIVFMTF